jgi:hypothetical protein
MVGNFESLTSVYEEAHEASVLQEFEKIVHKHGAGKVLSLLGEETVQELYNYWDDICHA